MHHTPPRTGLLALAALALCALAQSACHHHTISAAPIAQSGVESATLFVGEGRLSHPPEFVELTVTVHAECYPTPIEAVKAADGAVSRVMTLLKAKLDPDNPKDGILASGGYTEPYYRRLRNGGVVCEGTFQKTAQVVMKTSKVATFPKDFADIQNIVLTTMSNSADPSSRQGVTYAKLGTPTPQLYYETRERLEQEALADALENARQKFEATADVACGSTSHRIVKFTEPGPSSGRPIAYGAAPSFGGGGDGAAVGFDAIWVNKLLNVYFAIEGDCAK